MWKTGIAQNLTVRLVIWTCTLIVLGGAVGCGKGGVERVGVEGTVKFAGQPLQRGSILFFPVAGTIGPKSGAEIVGGKYKLEADFGPPVGEVRVEIRQAQQLPPDLTLESSGTKYNRFKPPPNTIPAKYNDRSVLSAKVVEGTTNRFDFDLKP